MKTDFNYIARAALEHTTVTKMMTNFAGFDIEVDVEAKAFSQYNYSKDFLTSELEKIGISPLAVVPKALWTAIADESGLMKVDTSGTIDLAVGKSLNTMLWAISTVLSVITAVSVFSATVFLWIVGNTKLWSINWEPANGAAPGGGLFTIFSALFVALTVAIYAMGWLKPVNRWLSARIAIALSGGRNKLFAQMYRRAASLAGSRARTVSFTFPTPPAAEAEVLRKLRDNTSLRDYIRIAAEPKAFKLTTSLTSLLTREMNDQEVARAEARRQRWADPIVYLEFSGAVAVVAQYGPFPIEKSVVDRIMRKG